MSTKLNIHSDIKNKLKYFVDTNKIPHIIFHGESGSGKREIVNFLMKTIYDSCYCNEDYIKYVNCAIIIYTLVKSINYINHICKVSLL